MKAYSRVMYAAAAIRPGDADASQLVADLFDLFFHEHRSRHKGVAQTAWQTRLQECTQRSFRASRHRRRCLPSERAKVRDSRRAARNGQDEARVEGW